MNSGYYAAFTGLVARLDALDVIANNLANVGTTGFRGQREFYSAVTANLTGQALTPLNRAINDFGVLGGSNLDLRQGSLQSTGNKLDLAIDGSAFLRGADAARRTIHAQRFVPRKHRGTDRDAGSGSRPGIRRAHTSAAGRSHHRGRWQHRCSWSDCRPSAYGRVCAGHANWFRRATAISPRLRAANRVRPTPKFSKGCWNPRT